jgi:hypothetical protein
MNVGTGNEATQFHFWEYINWIFGTVWNRCKEKILHTYLENMGGIPGAICFSPLFTAEDINSSRVFIFQIIFQHLICFIHHGCYLLNFKAYSIAHSGVIKAPPGMIVAHPGGSRGSSCALGQKSSPWVDSGSSWKL